MFIGRTDDEAETPILWPPDVKNWLIGKDPDGDKDWRQEEKGTTEDERVGWHYRLDGHEFEQALGVGDGQGSLACCSPWGHKESDTTEWMKWTETDGGKVEALTDLIFLSSKIIADGDCNHEIKSRLLLGRNTMTNLDSMLKSRHYFTYKGLYSQSYGFSSNHVWM